MRKFKDSYKQFKQTMEVHKMKKTIPTMDEKSGRTLWGTRKEE